MEDLLLGTYLTNAVVLIIHEIDSAYWREWRLFGLPGGVTLFLVLHFPLLFIVLSGLILVARGEPAGLVFSLILSLGGIAAFLIHSYFWRKGHREFDVPLSKGILGLTLALSVFQLTLTVRLMLG
ncbi:MAG: hypothetical protein JSU96_00935 [Acidobacteriota bacterium]|nr:MAG: hypothetical protein JSU96_00935 [Acidobacteriota bacterium]